MILLSDHLDVNEQDNGPVLRQLITDNPGGHFFVDGGPSTVYRFRRRPGLGASRARTLRLTAGCTWESDGAVLQLNGTVDDDAYLCWLLDADAGAGGITLANLVLDHRPFYENSKHSHAVRFYGGQSGLLVEGCTFLASLSGDCVYFGSGTYDVRAEDNTMHDHARSGIVIAGGGATRHGFLIRNNTSHQSGITVVEGRLVDFETTGNTAVTGCRIVGNAGPGAIETHRMTGEVRGNLCGAMNHTRTQGVDIEGNVVKHVEATGYAVRFIRYQQASFRNNVVESASHGVLIETQANGGVEWEEKYPDSLLTGDGNEVLMLDSERDAFGYSKWKPARSELVEPQVWHVAPGA